MSDYTKVLDGLHHCINLGGLEPNDTRIRCHGCPYFTEPTRCGGILMQDAAAAIEELQAVLKEADKKQEYQHDCICELTAENEEHKAEVKRLKMHCADCEYGNSPWPEEPVHEPKRGEWIGVSPMVDTVQCSVCGGQLFSAELKTPYCPYCGAEMEVQK